MPAIVGVSVNMPEFKAESFPLPESPAKVDKPATATNSLTSSLQDMPQVITLQAYSANDDDDKSSVESVKNAVGSNIPEIDISNKLAAGIRNAEKDSDHNTANKDDSKPVGLDFAHDNDTVPEDDAKITDISAQSNSDNYSVQDKSIAAICKLNNQSVNSANAKREFIISFQFAPAFNWLLKCQL